MRILLAALILLFSVSASATDTLRYSDGKIAALYTRYYFYKKYYHNGQMEYYNKSDSWIFKGRRIRFDSLGNITSKGKTKINGNAHGRWKYYSSGHIESVVNFRYGINVKELRNSKGRRVRALLTYGLRGWGMKCENVKEEYRIQYIAVAGCIITPKIQVKTAIHNFFVRGIMFFNYGVSWEEKIDNACEEKRF